MKEQIELLLQLDILDRQITDAENTRESYPARIDQIRGEVRAARGEIDALKERLAAASREREAKSKELDLERLRLRNVQKKEDHITNQREYEAFRKEIDSIEAAIEDIDEAIRAIGRQTIEIEGLISARHDSFEAVREERERLVAEMQSKMERIDDEINELFTRREKLTSRINSPFLRRYETILEAKGAAIAIVDSNGRCLSCNMALAPQLFNEVLEQRTLKACPICHKILLQQPQA